MGFTVKEVQSTPNPNAMKLILDAQISEQPMSFFNATAAAGHPLASQLFDVSGVTGVLLLGDFVTVNKDANQPWKAILKQVREILKKS